jgi:hypothetical protein
VILKHDGFFSFYGHLCSQHLVSEGKAIGSGERFATIGDGSDSGGWFTHTHLQILTDFAVSSGRTFQGYVRGEDRATIDSLFPSPLALFRPMLTP